jgi:hypothetical protein
VQHNLGQNLLEAYENSTDLPFLEDWHGHFNHAILDRFEKRLIIGADYYGTYPLFYSEKDGAIIFSNDVKWVNEQVGFDLDLNAVAEHLILGAPIGGKTIYSSILRLPMFSYLMVDSGGKAKVCQLPRTDTNSYSNLPIPELSKTLSNRMRDAVTECLRSHPGEWSLDLSGSLDTRLILSCIPNNELSGIQFQSIFTAPLTSETDRDVIIAKLIAEKKGLTLSISQMPLVEADTIEAFLDEFTSPKTNQKVMTGIMGGELLNVAAIRFIPNEVSTLRDLASNTSGPINMNCSDIQKIRHWGEKQLAMLFTPDNLHLFQNPMDTLINHLSGYLKSFNCKTTYVYEYFMRSFICDIYCNSTLTWMCPYLFLDKVGAPFLDNRILQVTLTLPDGIIQGTPNYPIYHKIYNKLFTELNDVPTTSTLGMMKGVMGTAQMGRDRKSISHPQKQFFPEVLTLRGVLFTCLLKICLNNINSD